MKKLLCILISAAMLVSMVSCTAPTEENEGTSSSTATEDSNATEESDDDSSEDTASGDVTEFDIVVTRWTDSWPTEFMNTGVMAELEEKHNVKINWDVYYNADWAEQKSLLLGSNDLPDAFWGSITLNDTDISNNKPAFVELTDLIAENMPNLSSIFEEDPSMYAVSVDRNGDIYSLPKKLPLRPVVGDLMFINQTWLDALSLEMPTTTEELETVLTAFVNDDPNGNGEADEYGFSYVLSLSGALRHILLPYGTMVSRAGNYMGMDTSGEPVFMPTEENYKEGALWLQGMFRDGLIDPESFTQDSSLYDGKTKGADGALVGITFGWTPDAQVGANHTDFSIVTPLIGPDGGQYAESDPSFLDLSRNELVITTVCEDPAKLLQWADDFYTDEVSLQTYYGSVADGKIAETDGMYELLIPEDGTTLDTSAWSYSFRDHGPKYMSPDFYDNVTLPTEQADGLKLSMEDDVKEFATETFPVVSYTDEQIATLSTLTVDLYDYVETTFAAWMTDPNADIEAEWQGYIDQLNAMGLQDYMAIQLDAYNAYVGNMG